MKGYSAGFRRLLLGSLGLLSLSGLLLAPTTLEFRLAWDVPWRLSGVGRMVATALHMGLSQLMLLLLGALWPVHIRARLKKGKTRYSGSVLLTLMLSLPVTGVGVLYLGDQLWADNAALAHLLIGLVTPLALVAHLLQKSQKVTVT